MREKIANAAWMDEATRKAALEKLGAFDPRIGHPVKWIDYSTLEVSRDDPLANDIASRGVPVEAAAQALPAPGRSHACGT